jgi:hypothetical protein
VPVPEVVFASYTGPLDHNSLVVPVADRPTPHTLHRRRRLFDETIMTWRRWT